MHHLLTTQKNWNHHYHQKFHHLSQKPEALQRSAMILSILMKFFYPLPASVLIPAMSVVSFMSASHGGWMETKGKHVQYSKLWNVGNHNDEKKNKTERPKVPSKTGMIISYTPALLAGVSSFFIFNVGTLRFNLVRAAITTHFFKRIMEVLFVHHYSGSMDVETMLTLSLSYFCSSAMTIYNQQLMEQVPEPAIDLKYVGVLLVLVGLTGNFYHHYLLSKLRTKDDTNYKVPQGGLFSLVICPHYLFEIVEFWGISCIAQTIYSFSFTMGSMLYLMGRSKATLKWYHSKFDEFPTNVKALIPCIF